jgi:NTE family protein
MGFMKLNIKRALIFQGGSLGA